MIGKYHFIGGSLVSVVEMMVTTFRCSIPVLPGGDGAETAPLAERTAKCGHPANVLVGAAPTCDHHLTVVARIAGISRDDFLGPATPRPCPS